jgi:hypothetical protein
MFPARWLQRQRDAPEVRSMQTLLLFQFQRFSRSKDPLKCSSCSRLNLFIKKLTILPSLPNVETSQTTAPMLPKQSQQFVLLEAQKFLSPSHNFISWPRNSHLKASSLLWMKDSFTSCGMLSVKKPAISSFQRRPRSLGRQVGRASSCFSLVFGRVQIPYTSA